MLRTNLSTRPFYNERGVHYLLAATALLVGAFTVFNLTQLVMLTRGYAGVRSQAAAAEARTQELRTHAAQTRQALDARQLESISTAAREANTIINQRLFSWTDLLNRFETTLPDEARIMSLRPTVDKDGSITVQITVAARSVDEIEEFMANLEKTAAFSDVFPVQDERSETGLVLATIEGKYAPAP